jgi:hypothetical protein
VSTPFSALTNLGILDISGQAGCMGISERTVLQTYDTLLPSTLYEVILVCSYPFPVLKMQQSRSSER